MKLGSSFGFKQGYCIVWNFGVVNFLNVCSSEVLLIDVSVRELDELDILKV
jgi:hypothetical protein